MAVFDDHEMLESWIGLEFAPDFKSTGRKVTAIEGVGSQNVAFRLEGSDREASILSLLRTHLCFVIGLPPNKIFSVYVKPLAQGAEFVLQDLETYNLRNEYYQSLYERLKLLIGSPFLAHTLPVNVVAGRLALALVHYWTSDKKQAGQSEIKQYSHLIGSSLVSNVLKQWAALDPEQVKQYWQERSGFAADSYDVTIAEERLYLGPSAWLAQAAEQTLTNMKTILDDLEAKTSFDFKDNVLLPYFLAFTSSYEFDWSVGDEIQTLAGNYTKDERTAFVFQIAEISHVLTNTQYFRTLPGRMSIKPRLTPDGMEIVKRLINILLETI